MTDVAVLAQEAVPTREHPILRGLAAMRNDTNFSNQVDYTTLVQIVKIERMERGIIER